MRQQRMLAQAVVAASLLLACTSAPPTEEQVSARSTAATRSPTEEDMSAPSTAATRFSSEGPGGPDVGAARLEVREAGKVALRDGQLAVSDAFINEYPLVVSDLPRGEFIVEILVAAAQSSHDQRIAAARVRLGTEPAATWRRVGFIAIDSGNAAFFDPRIAPQARVERFNQTLLDALEASARTTYSLAAISWEGRTFIAFSTGFGDGSYPVFLGSSAAGAPTLVLVDCGILPWPQ